MTDDKDPGYCGLDPETTGKYDPYWKDACEKHDGDFQNLIDGKPHPSLLEVSGDWVVNTTKVALKGVYAAATFPVYFLGGLIGGAIRWAQWKARGK